MNLKKLIRDKYSFLYAMGYEEESNINKGDFFSTISMHNKKSKIILLFTLEKNMFSLELSTESIMSSEIRYKYYDFFYIIRLLNPKTPFFEIKSDIYPFILKNKLKEINLLFSEEKMKDTISNLELIKKEYDKIRW